MENSQLELSILAAQTANDLNDPTVPLSSHMTFVKNDLNVTMHFMKSSNINAALKNKIFSLLKNNMMEVYKNCPWGWKERKKRAELFHRNAR